ncbi:hypothetical protein AAFF_G00047390 [Aldrovandia affinis]|uniref:Uncharacterized protein n=1 Tax=Aldrovandia affinis TaxID=143900 RepID=A0AAD7WER5_9TELE|nr:hypothetical protein AAFF_G00047390 [Aldrovandia affinis]
MRQRQSLSKHNRSGHKEEGRTVIRTAPPWHPSHPRAYVQVRDLLCITQSKSQSRARPSTNPGGHSLSTGPAVYLYGFNINNQSTPNPLVIN